MVAPSISTEPHQKPLAGKRIVITRARVQGESFARLIEELGGEVIEFPTIEIRAVESFAALDAAVERIETYDWLIFTSVNGIDPFLGRLQPNGKSLASLAPLKVGAIGSETAKRLEQAGIRPSLVPKRYQAEGILDEIEPASMRGKRVLIPRAAEAREILPQTLRQWGATVDVVVAYRTTLPAIDIRPFVALLRQRQLALITFTSSSTVNNFARLLGIQSLGEISATCAIACIGPITARTVCDLGGRVDIQADEFTITGMVRKIAEYFGTHSGAVPVPSGDRAD